MSRRGARLGPKPEEKPAVQINGSCQMFCVGLSMPCPLCGTLVEDGTSHRCARVGAITKIETIQIGRS